MATPLTPRPVRYSLAQQVAHITAGFGMCVGLLLLFDRIVTRGPSWDVVNQLPLIGNSAVTVVGWVFLLASIGIAVGAVLDTRFQLMSAAVTMLVAVFMAALFVINAFRQEGSGALAAAEWAFPAVILLWCVVHLRREL